MAEVPNIDAARQTGSLTPCVSDAGTQQVHPSPGQLDQQGDPSSTSVNTGQPQSPHVTPEGLEVTAWAPVLPPPGSPDVSYRQNGRVPDQLPHPLPSVTSTPVVTFAANPAAQFVESLHARGVSLGFRGNRLWMSPGSAYRELSDEERTTLREHRAAIKELIRTAGPFVISRMRDTAALAPQPEHEPQPEPQRESESQRSPQPGRPSEPEPVVFVGYRRVTAQDVRFFMADLGDDSLADYLAGRISKADAYAIAQRAMQQLGELR